MVYLTRKERFSAAHRMCRDDWDDAKNYEVFGPCSNPNWHGHNYVLWVTVKGEVSKQTGYVVDMKKLSAVIKGHVIEKVDHKNLNSEVSFLQNKIVSAEIIVVAFWEQLEQQISLLGAQLHSLKLEETENNYVEYFGH